MNKKKILSEYKNKIKLLSKYNKSYYEKNSPEVSDDNYDKLKKEIILLENEYAFLKSKNSPTQK